MPKHCDCFDTSFPLGSLCYPLHRSIYQMSHDSVRRTLTNDHTQWCVKTCEYVIGPQVLQSAHELIGNVERLQSDSAYAFACRS